jgi:cell shape-determining protein MreD
MVRELLTFSLLGLFFLGLQSTWLAVEAGNPLRPDLLFILLITLGMQNRLTRGVVFSVILGGIVDLLSWGLPGPAIILYPLILSIYFFIGTRTHIDSAVFAVLFVLVFQIFYGLLVYFSLYVFRDLEFTQTQFILLLGQALITMVVSIPLIIIFQVLFKKKPVLT